MVADFCHFVAVERAAKRNIFLSCSWIGQQKHWQRRQRRQNEETPNSMSQYAKYLVTKRYIFLSCYLFKISYQRSQVFVLSYYRGWRVPTWNDRHKTMEWKCWIYPPKAGKQYSISVLDIVCVIPQCSLFLGDSIYNKSYLNETKYLLKFDISAHKQTVLQ